MTENPLQLITKVQTAPNSIDDSQLLAEALPNLKERTDLDLIITDGGHGSPETDAILCEQQVEHIQTAIRGRNPDPEKLHLSDFAIKINKNGKPVKVTCPLGETVVVQTSAQKKAFVAHFSEEVCQACPMASKCPVRSGKRDRRYHLRFSHAQAHISERRRRNQEHQGEGRNLRAAIEATVRSIKHPFPASKLPVRGQFRVACLMVGSAAMSNIRRIQRYLEVERKREKLASNEVRCRREQRSISFFMVVRLALEAFGWSAQFSM